MKAFKIAAVLAVLTVAACSDDDDNEASAEFTGDEFEITVSDVTEERMDVGFSVHPVPDGTTVADVREKGIEEVMGLFASEWGARV